MSNKNTEALLLTQGFLTEVKQMEHDEYGKIDAKPEYKKAVLLNAYRCLYSGYEYEEILTLMKDKKGSYYNIEELIKETNASFKLSDPKVEADNCIHVGQFYYHPLLQESRPAPKYYLDNETMEFTKEEPEPFFLEIKEQFTSRDVLMYYYITHQKDPLPGKGALTQMQNLLFHYPLDIVLYLIDASAEAISEGDSPGAGSPAFLTDYIERAKEMYLRRKQTAKEGGLTHVTPRHTYSTLT